MGRMSDWMIDMDSMIGGAIESGAVSTNDVIAYAKTNMPIVDEKYIARRTEEFMGPPEEY